jgi:hypothetical protein
MKLLIPIILILFCNLAAQELNEIEYADSLNLIVEESADSLSFEFADSLAVYSMQDSLLEVEPDSILHMNDIFADSLLTSEEVMFDSLDIVKLHNDLQLYLENKKELRENFQLPMIVENEDFHLKTPFNPNLHFSKNGFTHFPFLTSNIHTIQNYAPLLNAVYDKGFVDFTDDNYSLPVASTDVFLGLGDINMNHAAMNYHKGNIVGIPDLNLEVGYVGMDGKWLGKREKSRNFNGHLFYQKNWGKLHLYYTNIDMEISSNKLANPPQILATVIDRNSDIAVKLENSFLNIGYRSENAKVDSIRRKLTEYWINKDIEFRNHQFKFNYEYFTSSKEDDFQIINLNHNSEISIFNFGNRLLLQEKDDYYLASLLKAKLHSCFQLQINFEKQESDSTNSLWQSERLGGGFILDFSQLNLNVLAGKDKIDDESISFVESKLKTNYSFGILNIALDNWTLFHRTANVFAPQLQTQTNLEFQLDVKHDNLIKFGISNTYLSEYAFFQNNQETETYSSYVNFDAWLAFQITKQFQIKLDAVNLTNAYSLFGLPAYESLAGRHFNFNIQWTFIN